MTVHREIYKEQRHLVTCLIQKAQKEYYCNLVIENSGDQKALFSVIKSLTGNTRDAALPQFDDSLEELCDKFNNFFADKITTIRTGLKNAQKGSHIHHTEQQFQGAALTHFHCPTTVEVRKIVMSSPSKSSLLDPIPTWLLKNCVDVLIPVIHHIVKLSMQSGSVPLAMKSAVITPIIKKPNLEPVLKNFRPVSNLTFVSKVLERSVAVQLQKHLINNNICDTFQSAYRAGHSVETALVRVQNDLLYALDVGKAAILILLDLSTAFDTVDHDILLH